MFMHLFESREQYYRDRREVQALIQKYGQEAKKQARARANDARLSGRDRKHWSRIAAKV